LIESFE